MGIFDDLYDLTQDWQLASQKKQTASLEERVARAERELASTRDILRVLIQRLETHLAEDVNKDGKIG